MKIYKISWMPEKFRPQRLQKEKEKQQRAIDGSYLDIGHGKNGGGNVAWGVLHFEDNLITQNIPDNEAEIGCKLHKEYRKKIGVFWKN